MGSALVEADDPGICDGEVGVCGVTKRRVGGGDVGMIAVGMRGGFREGGACKTAGSRETLTGVSV